jgi:hypothetical protein
MRSMEARKARSSGRAGLMSALGHEQTSRNVRVMSVIPFKTDIRQRERHVRYVPTHAPQQTARRSKARERFPLLLSG